MITHVPVKKGTADVSCTVRVWDSTDGTPETGVTFETAGVDLWYRRGPVGSVASITEVTLAAVTTAHADGGFIHVGNGYCRLDLPDAACAAGTGDYVEVGGTFTGMIVTGCIIPLTAVDLQDTVRGGMTALPNAAADAAGGLPISDAGALDIDTLNANVTALLAGLNDFKLWSGTFTAADATTITMADEADANAIYVGARVGVVLVSGTNCNGRVYFGTVGATRVITVDGPFTGDGLVAPTGTIVGAVYAVPKAPTISTPTVQLADGHLTAAKFGADCITADKIADDAIVAANLATGAITADAFAADAIVAATLATGVITADAFAADAIVAATLATNAITTDALADGTITAAKLGADCITNAKIADNAIAVENLAADCITAAKIADNAIAAEHLNATACTKIIDNFETQSQADPTGFHVNTKEVNSVSITGTGVEGDSFRPAS